MTPLLAKKQLLCEDSERMGQGVELLRSWQWLDCSGRSVFKVSNIVRNMVFLKGHILMLLSRYFTEKYILQKIGKLLLI